MRIRPARLTSTLTILAVLVGLPIPDATYSADPTRYAHIQDDDITAALIAAAGKDEA